MATRGVKLPPVEELLADADAGRFDDHVDDYLPEALYTRKTDDFLDEVIPERTSRDPGFPALLEQAKARRTQLRS